MTDPVTSKEFGNMRPPVQIWSSLFWHGSYDSARLSDLHRARAEWRGESRIWLDPDAEGLVRWKASGEQPSGLLIPSDTINVIDVWHVDEHSRIYPQTNLAALGDGSLTAGVYRRWLDQEPAIYYQPNDTIGVRFPQVEGDRIVFRDRKIRIQPGPLTPSVEPLDDSSHQVAWRTGRAQSVVDLQSEMERATGPAYFTKDDDGLLLAASDQLPGQLALSTNLGWHPPIDDLFPAGGGVDHLHHLALMRDAVDKLEHGKAPAALKESERWLSHFSGRITSNQNLASFMPTGAAMASHGEEAILYEVEARYDVDAVSLGELHKIPKFTDAMKAPVEVAWLDGWLGYMWWEINQDILEGVAVRFCGHCGHVLRGGRKDRQYCRDDENKQCVRERGAIRQRQRRVARKKA